MKLKINGGRQLIRVREWNFELCTHHNLNFKWWITFLSFDRMCWWEASRWPWNCGDWWCIFSPHYRVPRRSDDSYFWIYVEHRENCRGRKGIYLFWCFGHRLHSTRRSFKSEWNLIFPQFKQIPPWEAFKSEISFALNFWIDTKPVRAKSSEGLVESRKSSLPRSLKSRSERFGSEPRSHAKKSTRSLNFDEGIHDSNSRSLLNLNWVWAIG